MTLKGSLCVSFLVCVVILR